MRMYMNKWKGSWLAKLGAWIGIIISGVLFLGSVVTAYAIWEMGFYEYDSKEELRQQMFKEAARQYAVMALSDLEYTEKRNWEGTYFRHGIIKAENIDNIDFNDESNYVERNFTEEVNADDLYMVSHKLGDGISYSYTNSFIEGRNDTVVETSHSTGEPVNEVYYNIDMGIFYYVTDTRLYPVQEVKIGYTTNSGRVVYSLVYDFDVDMYRTQGVKLVGVKTPETATVEIAAVEESAQKDSKDENVLEEGDAENIPEKEIDSLLYFEEANAILEQEYVTLDMLDSSGWNYTDWEYLILDGRQHINDTNHISRVENDAIGHREITDVTDYELTDDNFIEIHSGEKEKLPETYWVVMLLPKEVAFGWSNDLFVQANALTTVGYSLRYSIYLIGVIAFAAMIAWLVFLINAAGHRKGTEEITLTWLDRIPFDVYLGIMFLAEGFLLYLFIEASYYIVEVPGMAVFILLLIGIGMLALLVILSFAVRVKQGRWWKNTVIGFIWRSICWVVRLAMKNLSLFWKVALLVVGIKVAELFLAIAVISMGIGGALLLGIVLETVQFFAIFWGAVQMQRLKEGGCQLAAGNLEHRVHTEKMYWEFKRHGENLNSISTGMSRAVDERMKSERFKTELITNVSHDIKTPLTSIINYVDLLEKEDLENETAKEYVQVLERQSSRLKKLIEDLMEASKASTGNLAVHMERLEAGVSMVQTVGEFEEKTDACGLKLLIEKPDTPVYIMADSRHFWRVIDNLMNNICKYAQPDTRVYINLETVDGNAVMTFRNTSKYPLNITSEELMERFVRGDSSRNTEGSGLGLSIARSLMELMNGSFELYIDGDLFKVVLKFNMK